MMSENLPPKGDIEPGPFAAKFVDMPTCNQWAIRTRQQKGDIPDTIPGFPKDSLAPGMRDQQLACQP